MVNYIWVSRGPVAHGDRTMLHYVLAVVAFVGLALLLNLPAILRLLRRLRRQLRHKLQVSKGEE
jgi:hypothetical protein